MTMYANENYDDDFIASKMKEREEMKTFFVTLEKKRKRNEKSLTELWNIAIEMFILFSLKKGNF